jgi:hypothetical protein
MRERGRANAAHSLNRIPQLLHTPWVVYEILRLKLQISLDFHPARLASLEALRQEWSRDLQRLNVPNGFTGFSNAIPNPLRHEDISEGRFEQLFNAVLAIEPADG